MGKKHVDIHGANEKRYRGYYMAARGYTNFIFER